MQDDMNNPPPFFSGRPVAGRLVSTRLSSFGSARAWYEKQNIAVQVCIAIVVVFIPLITFLLAITSFSGHTDTAAPQSLTSLDALTTPVVPTPTPTVMPTPTSTLVAQTATPLPDSISNPWGYDFAAGSFITSPPANFCIYFSCITNFRNGQGYVVECQDGAFSLTGGVAGSCADHKGDLRPLYFHLAPPTPVPPTAVPVPTATPIPPTPTIDVNATATADAQATIDAQATADAKANKKATATANAQATAAAGNVTGTVTATKAGG
jgi:hypothetical protein